MDRKPKCPRCGFPIDLAGAAPGSRIDCAQCHLEIIARAAAAQERGAPDEYGLSESWPAEHCHGGEPAPAGQRTPGTSDDEYAVVVPDERPANGGGHARLRLDHGDETGSFRGEGAASRRVSASIRRRPPPPPWPLVHGIVDFPFRRGHRSIWFRLSGFLGTVLILWGVVGYAASLGGALAVVFSIGLPTVLTFGWMAYAGAWGVVVFRDTAEGCDRIESEPEPVVTDWVADSLLLLGPLFWAGLAAAVVVGLLRMATGELVGGVVPWHSIVLFLLWPVMILACAEEGSPWSPTGLGAWKSLWDAGRHWLLFYVQTIALVLAAELILSGIVRFGPVSTLLALLLYAAVVGWLWLAYFRLLGRLAAVITDVQHRCADEAQAEAAE